MTEHPSVENALHKLAPGAKWQVKYSSDNSNYEIVWLDDKIPRPSDARIKTEVAKLAKNWENTSYARARMGDYPPIEDLADAIYWEKQGNPEPLQAYLAACRKVKKKHPKPEQV